MGVKYGCLITRTGRGWGESRRPVVVGQEIPVVISWENILCAKIRKPSSCFETFDKGIRVFFAKVYHHNKVYYLDGGCGGGGNDSEVAKKGSGGGRVF
jgi:hypothetical protein